MTERQLMELAIKELNANGFLTWKPGKVKFYENDIFGVFDLVAFHDRSSGVYFIQVTTTPNLAARRNKILGLFNRANCTIPNSFVWAWDKKSGSFVRELVSL